MSGSPALLRRLIVDLMDKEDWSAMRADVKGDIYDGILSRSASESLQPTWKTPTPEPRR